MLPRPITSWQGDDLQRVVIAGQGQARLWRCAYVLPEMCMQASQNRPTWMV